MNDDDEEGQGAEDRGHGFDEFRRAVHDVSPFLILCAMGRVVLDSPHRAKDCARRLARTIERARVTMAQRSTIA
jgi:hypothetical protein